MRYNRLGNTGLFVSELCLGTMTFGGGGSAGDSGGIWKAMGALEQEASETLIGRAIEKGINFIDTADVYSSGVSEEITGNALRNLKVSREAVVVATKGYGTMGTGQNAGGASRFHLIEACKASLKRLQLDHIDLYQIHGFDPATPIEETMRALETLVQHGHVRYVGVSNWQAWQIMKAQGIAAREGLTPLASLQAYYTLAGRDLERELVPMLLSEQVGLMVWSPLAGGFLSGKYGREDMGKGGGSDRRAVFDFPPVNLERGYACIDAMRPIADAHGVSVAQIALAWLLHRKVVSSVIIGAKRPEQLDDNLAAVEIALSAAELDALDAVSALPLEYPGWMFATQGNRARQVAATGRPGLR